jgi:hypothetical protein
MKAMHATLARALAVNAARHAIPPKPAKPTYQNPIWYGKYRIYFDMPPIPVRTCDWHFVHDDYDGEDDPRCGDGPSIEACKAEIDEIEAEIEPRCEACRCHLDVMEAKYGICDACHYSDEGYD